MIREYYGLKGVLTVGVGSGMLNLFVNPEFSGAIAVSGFVSGVDEAYFSVTSGGYTEVVKVIGIAGDVLIVDRAQVGTVAQAFPQGATIEYVVTSAAIIEQIGAISTDVNLTGSGAVTVTEGATNNFNVDVPIITLTGEGRISVLGSYPDFKLAYTPPESDCCGENGDSSGDAIVSLQGEGIAVAFTTGDVGIVRVTPPVFTAGPNISIVGSWPNYTISATAGSGSVTSVTAGSGLTLTGTATVNPTLSITNTGVVAGVYGGVNINSRGQIAAVPATFNPVSIINAGAPGYINVSRVGDAVTVGVDEGAIGAKGVVEFADHTDPFDPLIDNQAATPAYINMALQSLVLPSMDGASSFTAESDATYTNTISGSATPISLLAGEKALVTAEVTMLDGTTPTNAVAFALGVFTAAAVKLKGNKTVNQCQQSMTFIVEGPIATSLSIATSAIPAGASVVSYSLVVQSN